MRSELVEFEAVRGMPADADVVYGQVADDALAALWGPPWPEGAPVRRDDEQHRLEWGHRHEGPSAGWLQVADYAAGASEVSVHVWMSGAEVSGAGGPREVQSGLARSLDALAGEVGSRVNDAS